MKISEALGVTSGKLWKQGVFDAYLGIDSRLHIDPALLRSTRVHEFKKSLSRFEKYFEEVLVLLSHSSPGGALERQSIDRLIFPEIDEAALGFSEASSHGRGVSRVLARQMYGTAKEIVNAGIKDPAIFELAAVFEDGFGPDLISDMVLYVILQDVSAFNERVCSKLGIQTKQIKAGNQTATAAYSVSTGKPILLLPQSLLASLPEAKCFSDIDSITQYNDKVRDELNRILGSSWSRYSKRYSKTEMRKLLLSNPELFKGIIQEYRARKPKAYDFENDPLGEVVWEGIGKEFSESNELLLSQPTSEQELIEAVRKMIKKFKQLVEYNGLSKHLFDESGRQRPEKFSQLLFYAIADSYCEANNLAVSAEPNAGRGPVDFKVDKGYDTKVVVELKLSSNSGALSGLLVQLPEYAKAEQAQHSCYLLIVVGPTRTKVDEIKKAHAKLKRAKQRVPDLVIVDAYSAFNAPSASKLKLGYRF
ncbi:MAG TPA: hypothetical protein VGH19_15445 [Verrucomicrobiae bacterium]